MIVAIYGYGKVAKGVEKAIYESKSVKLFGIFSRRDISTLKSNYKSTFYPACDVTLYKNEIDVLINCIGSYNEVIKYSENFSEHFNVVDSYDNHKNIKNYINAVDIAYKLNCKTAIISAGWDPGLFSIIRAYLSALISTNVNTFWGKGISQGHSQILRGIDGVLTGVQYTIPIKSAIKKCKKIKLKSEQMHLRKCVIVKEKGAKKSRIINSIKSIENYYLGYKVKFKFVSLRSFIKRHNKTYHAGKIMANSSVASAEFNLKLPSNADFTGKILLKFAFIAHKLNSQKIYGAKTVFDIPPAYLIDDDYYALL